MTSSSAAQGLTLTDDWNLAGSSARGESRAFRSTSSILGDFSVLLEPFDIIIKGIPKPERFFAPRRTEVHPRRHLGRAGVEDACGFEYLSQAANLTSKTTDGIFDAASQRGIESYARMVPRMMLWHRFSDTIVITGANSTKT